MLNFFQNMRVKRTSVNVALDWRWSGFCTNLLKKIQVYLMLSRSFDFLFSSLLKHIEKDINASNIQIAALSFIFWSFL